MPKHIFIHYGYNANLEPQLNTLPSGAKEFSDVTPRGQTVTLVFNNDQRFCTGWHDLATSLSHPCPSANILPAAYSQCRHCQQKTGFNPAFYHSPTVSPQQQARNAQPHSLYLAHFAPGLIKVGITWSERGLRRLLDQGARSCLMIKKYPNANLARQYEAKIAALPGIAETLKLSVKSKLLTNAYDAALGLHELLAARQRLQNEVGITPDNHEPLHLDKYYLDKNDFTPHQLVILTGNKISGRCLGMIGSHLMCEQDGITYALQLGNKIGYELDLSDAEEPNEHQPLQTSLF